MLLIFRYSLLKTAHMLITVIKFLLQTQKLFKDLPPKKKKKIKPQTWQQTQKQNEIALLTNEITFGASLF